MSTRSKDVRETFIRYFESKNHKHMRSSSLIPLDDPTLLFTNAGMNQFKDIFTGQIARPTPCATTAQKCMRVSGKHNDLENVGRTARHHTFFEMLGNFSFGDYFKQEAIRLCWELASDIYKLDKNVLYATVFEEDDDAFDIWRRETDIAEDHIVRMGAKDNFWSMGETGPCGPCSELHVDQGSGPGDIWKDEDIYGDSDRFLEIWNLVFMQFDRQSDGTLLPLPSPSVDTGAGLERITAIKQGVFSNYDTDLFQPIIQTTCRLSGKTYGANDEDDTSLRVIADHARATAFLIGDGMLPSNEHRGYVLRRIMRRAIRHGKRLGLDNLFMPDICEVVISEMGDVYTELTRNRDFILNVAREEEKSFRRTLNTGLDILEMELGRLKTGESESLPGDLAFKLYDTYGFPLDLTQLIAAEHGKLVDMPGFDAEMKKQRERGRASWKGAAGEDGVKLYGDAHTTLGKDVEFVGYDEDQATGVIKAILSGGQALDEAPEGMDVEVITDRTPFYGESGGQVGDRGLLLVGPAPDGNLSNIIENLAHGIETELQANTVLLVLDTRKPIDGLFVHKGRILKGSLKVGDEVGLYVDSERRNAVRRNHSATHLLQFALRQVLGTHVKQSGSWVGPDRLRFDFTHFQALTPDEIAEVERLVNAKVRNNDAAETVVKSLDEAQESGATAIFGEKYGDTVRVVTLSSDSMELCGGTHVRRSGDIGFFKVISETSIASGIRRIEAVTGQSAIEQSINDTQVLQSLASMLSTAPAQLEKALSGLFNQQKADKKRIEQLQLEKARLQSASLLEKVEIINEIKILCTIVEDVDPKVFRDYGSQVLDKLGSGVVFLAAPINDKVNFLLAVSEDLRKKVPAGKTIGKAAAEAGAKGGGRPDMAQAGGGDPSRIASAFDKLKEIISAL